VDAYEMMSIIAGYYRHRQMLQVPWARRLVARSNAAADRQRKLAELFDVFDDCFAPGEKGKQRATTFLQLHEELLGRQTPQKGIEKAAAVFQEQLGKLPQAQRDRFKEIGREMKAAIKTEAELAPKRVIEAIEKLGGRVRLDPKKPGNPVIEVDLANARVADADLEILQDLHHLQVLDLHYTKITDKGLVHLKRITSLQGLHLHGLAITNEGMAQLAGLTDLRWLNITSTGVTSDGLKHLKAMSKLEHLQCGGIDDAGMVHLKELTNLKALHLYQCFLSDAGLKHLEGLTNLQGLHFGSDKITNDGLKHLVKLSELRDLTLDVPPGRFGGGNPITDPGLEHLRGLKKLECLRISATGVTSAGVKRLQQALPKLKIEGRRSQIAEQD
jgi:hypothetical protein